MVGNIRKKRIVTFMSLCLWGIFLHADEMHETFFRATQAYEIGEFEKALELFKTIIPLSPAVLLNLGNCYFHMGNTIEAQIYWKKAQYAGDATVFNYAQQGLDKIQNTQRYSLFQYVSYLMVWLSKKIPTFLWQLCVLGALLLLFFIFLYTTGKLRMSLSILSLFCISFGCVVFYKDFITHRSKIGIVTSDSSLYINPSQELSCVSTVCKEAEVVIMKEHDGWYKIAYQKNQGWIRQENVALISS